VEERKGIAGWPRALCAVGLTIFQYLAVRGSMERCAWPTVASTVSRATQALPRGLSGPQGSASQLTSTSEFCKPSTIISSLTLK
jgi:hypothetical protein